jgi:transposase InsO family protein
LLLGKRYLLHDRDEKFVHGFDAMLRASGVEPVVLPPRSPHLQSYCERFVRSSKDEARNQMIVIGEAALRSGLQSSLTHSHQERNQQGLGNHLIAPAPGMESHRGHVVRRECLGGLCTDSHREAA